MNLYKLSKRFNRSNLIKDSFWAVFGNGFGNALLLLAGILIARGLGKDLYGEYGVVKTNMFYMAGLSTFGFAYTTTRFISKYQNSDKTRIIGIIKIATKVTLIFSSTIAIILAIFADSLESFLDVDGIASVFRVLSVIIIIKALASTGAGILAGLKKFKTIAWINIIAGASLLLLCVPFTYYFGLYGALSALAISQSISAALIYWEIFRESRLLPLYCYSDDSAKSLLRFSFPVALQEISFSLCHWAGILMLTKLSNLSEVGIYSATAQWNAVIMMLPVLLVNVVLSYLSGVEGNQQHRLVYRLLLVYLLCTALPFLGIYLFTDFIVSFYGNEFETMGTILRLSVLITIPACCSEVFKAELMAVGKPWTLFLLRMMKDLVMIGAVGYFLTEMGGKNGAYYYVMANLIGNVAFFFGAFLIYQLTIKTKH